jgi:tetratricopeptide (TPR) repeat protein
MASTKKASINALILITIITSAYVLYKKPASRKELPMPQVKSFTDTAVHDRASPVSHNQSRGFSYLGDMDNLPNDNQTAIVENQQDIWNRPTFDVNDFITSFINENRYEDNTLNRLGDLLRENGYKQEALDAYDQAIQQNKGDIAASLIAIGDIETEDSGVDAFFDYSVSVINLHRNDNNIYESLADFFREKGVSELGVQLLEYGLQYNSDNNNYINFYNSYRDFIYNAD